MVRTVAAGLILADVANSITCISTKMEVPSVVPGVTASCPLIVRGIVNVISYKSMTLNLWKEGGFEHASGASKKCLSSRPL